MSRAARQQLTPSFLKHGAQSGLGECAGQGSDGRQFAEALAAASGLLQQLLHVGLGALVQQRSEPVGLRDELASSRLNRHQDLGDKGMAVITFTLSTRS